MTSEITNEAAPMVVDEETKADSSLGKGNATNAAEDDDNDDDAEGGRQHRSLADRPILCVLEEKPLDPTQKRKRCRMFRVIHSKGKALASGGFGVTVITDESGKDYEPDDENENEEDVEQETTTKTFTSEEFTTDNLPNDAPNEAQESMAAETETTPSANTKRSSSEYLFIEEVLFLHEQGLLRALKRTQANESTTATDVKAEDNNTQSLDTSQLYQLLPSMGMSLAMYRVYSHLRSQDFRVLRHHPDRYEIFGRNNSSSSNNNNNNSNSNSNSKIMIQTRTRTRAEISQRHSWSRRRRFTATGAAPQSTQAGSVSLCWDAYHPNSNFGKTHPGLPDFYVAVTYYNVPTVRFSDFKALLRDKCHGIPLKVATVSDSGT
eukprot:jgi/Psemu1/20261/gm1.20261_g